MKIEPAVVAFPIVAIAVVAYLGFGSMTGIIGSNTTTTETNYPPNPLASSGIPVLVLQPGTSGKIYVTYYNSLGNAELNQTAYANVYTPHPSPGSFDLVSPSSVSVVPNPATITFNQGATNESAIVVFTITVAPNATKGVYGIFLFQFCTLFPMVVGSTNGIGASSFSYWYPHQGSCPAQVMTARVAGVSGFVVSNFP